VPDGALDRAAGDKRWTTLRRCKAVHRCEHDEGRQTGTDVEERRSHQNAQHGEIEHDGERPSSRRG